MTQFFYGAVDDLEIQDVQMRIVEPKRPGEEFLHDRGLQVVFRTIEQALISLSISKLNRFYYGNTIPPAFGDA